MSDNKNLTITVAMQDAMRDSNQIHDSYIVMERGFVGEYSLERFDPRKDKADKEVSFTALTKGPLGWMMIPGYSLVNALIVPKTSSMDNLSPVRADRPGVYYQDSVQAFTSKCSPLHSLFTGVDVPMPGSIQVLGAIVRRSDEGNHPEVKLRVYPFYKAILAHHKLSNPGATFVRRDEINLMLKAEGALRPPVPAGYELKLEDESSAWVPSNWNGTFLIREW